LKINNLLFFTFLSSLGGLLLRIYSLGFFEFKADQAKAVLAARHVYENSFLVSHGMMSGVGLPNPPGFYLFMGLFSIFGDSPVYFASVFLLFSCLFPLVTYLMLRRNLDQETLLVTVILLALSPMLIVFSCNIWAQCMIPLFSLFVIWTLIRFIEKKQDVYWIMAVAAAMLAGSIHLSGMFLLPVIAFTILKKRPAIKSWAISVLAGVLIFGYWIIFLTKHWNWKLFPARHTYLDNLLYSLQNILFFPTNFFLKSYFPEDFLQISGFYAGMVSAWLLLICGSMPIWILFVCACSAYIKTIKGNWRKAGSFSVNIPVAVQISILIFLLVPITYLVMGIRVHVFYLLAVIPAFFVVCAYGFSLLKVKLLKYGLLVLFVIAVSINSYAFLRFIDYSGGHPEEYGPSYGLLKGIVRDIDNIRGNKAISLKIIVKGKARKKFDPLAIQYVFRRFMNPKGIPLYMEIFWDKKNMRFVYNLSTGIPESMRKELRKRRNKRSN